MNWPSKSYGHAAAFVFNSFLLIMGREQDALGVMHYWMYEFTKMIWGEGAYKCKLRLMIIISIY